MSGPGRGIKRAFDIVVATAALLILSPLLLIVSLAIKLESRGPVFVRETLYGYRNRAIGVLKFRSATVGGSESRVTRVGRVLRRTGIDELPLLLSVLGGEMSIVGPRAYARRQDLFEHRPIQSLDGVKPGLTGLAQIAEARQGFRTAEQRVNDDLRYVKTWSLFLDIEIILATLASHPTAKAGDNTTAYS